MQITINLISDAAVNWKQTGFIEFRFVDVQSRVLAVVIANSEVQQFTAAHTSRVQQDDCEADSFRAQRRCGASLQI
jgi:hypothetical protein